MMSKILKAFLVTNVFVIMLFLSVAMVDNYAITYAAEEEVEDDFAQDIFDEYDYDEADYEDDDYYDEADYEDDDYYDEADYEDDADYDEVSYEDDDDYYDDESDNEDDDYYDDEVIYGDDDYYDDESDFEDDYYDWEDIASDTDIASWTDIEYAFDDLASLTDASIGKNNNSADSTDHGEVNTGDVFNLKIVLSLMTATIGVMIFIRRKEKMEEQIDGKARYFMED